MFSKIIHLFDKPHKDDVYDYLTQNNKFNKTQEWFGFSVFLIFILFVVSILFFVKNMDYIPPAIHQVSQKTLQNKTYGDKLITLNQPRITRSALEKRTIDFVNDFYNLNFNNFDQKIRSNEKWFTKSGYLGFLNAVEKHNLKNQLIKNKQLMTLTVSENVILKSIKPQKTLDGQYTWQVEVAAIMSTTSGFTINKPVNISILWTLEQDNKNKVGLYVEKFSMNK